MATTEVLTPVPVLAPAPESASAPALEASSSGRQMDPTNLKTYLHRLGKKVTSGMHISEESMVTTNELFLSLAKKVVRTADAIVICRGNQRLSLKEIQAAAVTLNDSQLVLQANIYAMEAIHRYDPTIPIKSPSSSTEPGPTQPVSQTSSQAATPSQPPPSEAPPSEVPAGTRRKAVSRSSRANLTIDVARVDAMIRYLTESDRISETTPVYLAAFLEHIATELLRAAEYVTLHDGIHTIKSRHVILAVRAHEDLKRLNAEWLLCEIPEDE